MEAGSGFEGKGGSDDLIGQCHRYPSGLQRRTRYACCGRE